MASARLTDGKDLGLISKHLFVLLACLFVVMIGLGIAAPVLPFYVERLALADGASREAVVTNVGLLTGAYAIGQLAFAPIWMLYAARILGGILSSATLPVSAATGRRGRQVLGDAR
jgi:DHA1 family multidrug resistance protein-like MFS transporter